MSIVTEITRINTNIANSYTAVDNKNGTLPQVQNSANLASAIDSIEVIEQATAEGESLSLTNTKAMPYSDYVVEGKSEQNEEPSPSNPSEIHSVADDVNLLNLDNCTFDNCTLNKDGSIKSNINNSYFCVIETTQLNSFLMQNLGKSFIFSIKDAIENKYISIVVYGSRTGGGTYQEATVYSTSRKVTIPLANDFTNITKIAFRVNRSSTSFTDTTTVINELKLQQGSTATPYSPYNQGTVTIKQRGKNEFDTSNIISNVTDYTITVQNGGFIIRTGGMSNGTYFGLLKDLCPELKVGDEFKFNWNSNATRNNTNVNYIYLNLYANTIVKDTLYTCTQTMLDSSVAFYGQQGEYYKNIMFYLEGQTSDYEPYQTPHDYTFQTAPLRSLPNGVKDTIEADGIHRRVGRQILTDIEYLASTTVFGVEAKFGTYGLIGVKDENRNYNFMSDKIAPANENFLKYGAYRNQKVLIVMTSSDDTVENFNSKISGSEVLYELAEEIIEPLTQNQATTMLDIIKTGSYEGTTNIYTDEDVKPTIKVDYYKKG